MSTTLLNAVIPKLSQLVLALTLVTTLTSCNDGPSTVGNIVLKSEEQATLAVHVPSVGDRWRLRFGLLPWNKIDALRPTDRITVYLQNNSTLPVVFSPDFTSKSEVAIPPKDPVKVFEGMLSDLLLSGRGSYESMVFEDTEKSHDMKLYFVPHLEPESSFTMRVTLFYDHFGL